MSMPDLRLYLWRGVHVAAACVEDACSILDDYGYGDPRDEDDPDDLPDLVPGDAAIAICVDEAGCICDVDDGEPLELTADEWLRRENGRDETGFVLCWEQ